MSRGRLTETVASILRLTDARLTSLMDQCGRLRRVYSTHFDDSQRPRAGGGIDKSSMSAASFHALASPVTPRAAHVAPSQRARELRARFFIAIRRASSSSAACLRLHSSLSAFQRRDSCSLIVARPTTISVSLSSSFRRHPSSSKLRLKIAGRRALSTSISSRSQHLPDSFHVNALAYRARYSRWLIPDRNLTCLAVSEMSASTACSGKARKIAFRICKRRRSNADSNSLSKYRNLSPSSAVGPHRVEVV